MKYAETLPGDIVPKNCINMDMINTQIRVMLITLENIGE